MHIEAPAYEITVESVYDADTLTVDIPVGFGVILNDQKIRLHRIDAWEVRGDEREKGLLAKGRMLEVLNGAKKVVLKPVPYATKPDFKKGKYGRWLAEIFADGKNVNDLLVEEGHAEYKEY